MARQRKQPKNADQIKLERPDRSAPSEKTLMEMAAERNLFAQADARMKELTKQAKAANAARGLDVDSSSESGEEDEEDIKLSPGAERFLEAILWTATLAMIHFTFEVLVQSQYSMEIEWPVVWSRTARAWVRALPSPPNFKTIINVSFQSSSSSSTPCTPTKPTRSSSPTCPKSTSTASDSSSSSP